MKAMRPVYELEEGKSLADDQYDGMWDMLGDDILPTDWDCMKEDPPQGFWFGTHTREGMRIKGFTENEYIEGEGSGTVQRDDDSRPIYLGGNIMNSKIVSVSVSIGSGITMETELTPTGFGSESMQLTESQIETFLAANLNLLLGDNDLRLVGRQVRNVMGGACDLVVLDSEGDLVIIEIKRDVKDCNARTEAFEMQAIRYAANFSRLETVSDLLEQVYVPYLQKYDPDNVANALNLIEGVLGKDFSEDHFNKRQKIMLIASGFDPEALSGCAWLRKNGIEISCIQISPVLYGDKHLLVIEKILPPPHMDDMIVTVRHGKREPTKSDRIRTKLETTAQMLASELLRKGATVYIKGQSENLATVVDAKFVEKEGVNITWNDWVKKAKKLDAVSIYHHVTLEPGGQTLHELRMKADTIDSAKNGIDGIVSVGASSNEVVESDEL